MIQPVAAGRLFSVYGSQLSSDFQSQEQEVIARLERTRQTMLSLQAVIQRVRSDGSRPGAAREDQGQLQGQLKTAQDEYNAARSALAELRSGTRAQAGAREKKQSPVSNTYLERRSFAREFPDDAQRLRAYQIYDRAGNKTVFSSSYLQFLGTTVDMRI